MSRFDAMVAALAGEPVALMHPVAQTGRTYLRKRTLPSALPEADGGADADDDGPDTLALAWEAEHPGEAMAWRAEQAAQAAAKRERKVRRGDTE